MVLTTSTHMMYACLLVACVVATTAGSSITFTSDPADIESGTKSLTLHCGIEDTETSTSAIVGRSVQQTLEDVPFVTSVVISRSAGTKPNAVNTVHVASVSQFMPANVYVDLNCTHVTGAVSGSQGERGFLEVTWDFPTQNQTGVYTCDIQTMDKLGRGVTFSRTTEVKWVAPNIQQLANDIHDLAVLVQQKDEMIQVLQNKTQVLQDETQVLQNQTQILQDETIALKEALRHETEARQKDVEALRHTETGLVTFGMYINSYSQWTRDGNYNFKEMTVKFTKAYTVAPIVYLTVAEYEYRQHTDGDVSSNFALELVNVTLDGFTARCKSRIYSSSYHIYNMIVSWVSLPH